jgi:hypothetical protein
MAAFLLEEMRVPVNPLSKNGLTPLDLALSATAQVPRRLFHYLRARGAEFDVGKFCQHCTFEVMGWGSVKRLGPCARSQ